MTEFKEILIKIHILDNLLAEANIINHVSLLCCNHTYYTHKIYILCLNLTGIADALNVTAFVKSHPYSAA
jgi:hypothetical protein